MPDRLIPTYAGFTFSGLMAMVDLNFGALAGGLTVVGTAFLALSWQSSKNKVEAFKSMEAAKLQAKRDLDEYMKGSISNKLDSLQGSVDEAKDLATQRSSVITDLKLIIDTMRTRVEDANFKLHGLVNESNAAKLLHAAETAELQSQLLASKDELNRLNARLNVQVVELARQVQGPVAASNMQAAENKAQIAASNVQTAENKAQIADIRRDITNSNPQP